jgi:1,4-alpha-glucan branching enzyme
MARRRTRSRSAKPASPETKSHVRNGSSRPPANAQLKDEEEAEEPFHIETDVLEYRAKPKSAAARQSPNIPILNRQAPETIPPPAETKEPPEQSASERHSSGETALQQEAALPNPESSRPQGEARQAQFDATILHHEPHITENYDQTYLYALASASRAAYVFYEVGSGTREHLKQKFGNNFFDHNYLVLRVRRTDNNHSWEVEDYLDAKNRYWIHVDPNVEYECELGYRSKGTKFFERVAVSNRFRTLPEIDTRHEDQNEWRELQVPYEGKELPVAPNEWRYNHFEHWKQRKAHKPEEDGYWALVLHMHLPFVRHIEYPVALEEQWLFEAITSCYAPLLKIMWNLDKDKIDFRLTVSISPPLMSMLSDPALQERYREFLKESIGLAEKELHNNRGKTFQHTIETILERLHSAKAVFDAYGGNILHGFRDYQNLGKVEVMTCAGTHPILPYYLHYPEIVRGHIQLACRQYERIFGRWPRGMWLPENAFVPGLDHFLAKEGIKWTLANANGITRGSTRVWYGTHRPVVTHNGLGIFGIDEDTRAQVWSREAGYPGDARYKEWYRDLGYDAAWEYLPEYFKTGNVRRNTGLKYYRITGKNVQLHHKQPYNPDWARDAVNEQAGQFVCHRGAQAYFQRQKLHIKPLAVSAYDAELFGHWWEEGPAWLEMVFRKMCCDQDKVRPVTPSEFLAENPRHQLLMPGMATWGKKATYETWLDGRDYRPNVWVYRHLFRISEEMAALATDRKSAEGVERRALNQAAREMMLAQSSDWPFLISMDQSSRYAEVRLIKHIGRARELLRQVGNRQIDMKYLETLESADNFLRFDDMDYRVFCKG